jgi:NADPH-dependent ferric siderophore reductase
MGNRHEEPHGADAATRDAVCMEPTGEPAATRLRREPPRFRAVEVSRVEVLTPRLVRVTFTGNELDGFVVDEPAASVRILLPSPGADALVMPAWNGNEFLLPDGTRPAIRTFTPRHWDAARRELAVEMVRHDGGGVASDWAGAAGPGAKAAVSGPGRGYAVAGDAPAFFLAGDDTAIPAIAQLLEVLPASATVRAHVEIAHPDARFALPPHPAAVVVWHDADPGAAPGDALADAAMSSTFADGERIWIAGEAAAMQRIRRHLFQTVGIPRARTTIRGYWKSGRRGDAEE